MSNGMLGFMLRGGPRGGGIHVVVPPGSGVHVDECQIVLLILAFFADDAGGDWCGWPPVATIAAQAGKREETVRLALSVLEANGLIAVDGWVS